MPNQDDVHFDMNVEPVVVIAEPADGRSLAVGASVAIVTKRDSDIATGAVVIPNGLRVFAPGRIAWDRPAGSALLFGRIVARRSVAANALELSIAYGRSRANVTAPSSISVATIRGGSRRALLSPQQCFVFARPESDGISDAVDRIIVADGTLVVPI